MKFNKNTKDLKGIVGVVNVVLGAVAIVGCVVGGVKCIKNKTKRKDTEDGIENTLEDVFGEDGEAELGSEEPAYTPLFQKYKDDSEAIETIEFN